MSRGRINGPARATRDQGGVALITVLLVVALATVAAVHMTTRDQLDQRRTGNRLALQQAHELALGGERWAVAVLAEDLREGDEPLTDNRDQDWARVLPPMPVEGGQVAGRISDMQGRFNINTLVRGETINAVALERFERLLRVLELDPQLARAVVDWLDTDGDATVPAGAEDDHYAALETPHLAANRPAVVASELRMVRGFDDGVWTRLAPHVTALPAFATAINVNTATPAVLQAVVPGLAAEAAVDLHETLAEEPFTTVEDFINDPRVQAGTVADGDEALRSDGLAVRSRFFRTRVDVELADVTYTLYSWLQRDDNGASRVLRRTRSAN